jgi:ribosome recycling factor
MIDVENDYNSAKAKMDAAIAHLNDSLSHIRAGKANVRLLDGIKVDSYGQMVPINTVAAVATPDARSITVRPWDKNMFAPIEKAIINSTLGIMPVNNGEVIRIGIPPLTEERRKQLSKQCKAEAEIAKVSVRNIRRDHLDTLKKNIKQGLPEDVEKDAETKLQKLHDKYIKEIDDSLAKKDKEIMTV